MSRQPAKRPRPADLDEDRDAAESGAAGPEQLADEWKQTVAEWKGQEEAAEAMIPIIGRLYRESNVVTTMFGKGMVNVGSIEILKAHSFGRKHLHAAISPRVSLAIVRAFATLEVTAPTRLDVGKTTVLCEAFFAANPADSLDADAAARLASYIKAQLDAAHAANPCPNPMEEPRDVVLYGFGRIGRLLARILIEKTGGGGKLALRAIVVRPQSKSDVIKRASLLRRDSVHGKFNGIIRLDIDRNLIYANGTMIHIIYSSAPDQIDYTAFGIKNAVVLDNTGRWRDQKGMALHLKSKGVTKVVLTAPASGGDVTTVVAGVNDDRVTGGVHLYSAASCTTNAIAPVLKVVEDSFGIVSGHIETVHSFTNDQNLIDNFHKKSRRGRSAVLNMVITETGAGKAVSEALPSLQGKLTANAIRVPTPDVSLAIMSLQLSREATVKEVNEMLLERSLRGALQNQIDYFSSPDLVSTDCVGNRHASIVDSKATLAHGNRVNLYVWYDNEFGYSCQVIRLVQRICDIVPTMFPLDAAPKMPAV